MGPDSELKIKITTDHDGKGADAAGKAVDKTKRKADEASGAFGKMGQAARNASRMIRMAMGAMGFVAVIHAIDGLIKKWHAVKEAQEDALNKMNTEGAVKLIDGIAAAYDRLAQSIADAKRETDALRANTDDLLAAERRIEDARLARREEDEVAAIAPDDPLRGEKEKAVRARYAAIRTETSGKREAEDIEAQRKRVEEDIARIEGGIANREKLAGYARKHAAEAARRSYAHNENAVAAENQTNWLGMMGRDWLFRKNTDIERYQGYAKEEQGVSEKARAEAKKYEEQNSADRAEAARLKERLPVLDRQREAAAASAETSGAVAGRESAGADRGLKEAAARRDREAADAERARRDNERLEARKKAVEDEKAQGKWREQEADREAFRAQKELDAHDANRPRRGSDKRWRDDRAPLQGSADKAAAAATEVKNANQLQGEALEETLRDIARQMSANTSVIKAYDRKIKAAGADTFGDGEAAL